MLFIFDLWGTLILNSKSLVRIIHDLGADIDKRLIVKIIDENLNKKDISTMLGVKNIVRDLSLEGINIDESKLYREIVNNVLTAKPRKDLYEALSILRENNKVAILSNTNRDAWEMVKKNFNLDKYIDKAFLSFETNLLKPDPLAFLRVLEYFREKPFNAVMIGDSLQSDIIPAKRLGMNAFLIDKNSSLLRFLKEKSLV